MCLCQSNIKTIHINNIMANNNKIIHQMYSDIKCIENRDSLLSIEKIKDIMDVICLYNNITIIDKITPNQSNDGIINIVYILEDFHMSIHTFPDNNSIAFDFGTFKKNVNFYSIFEFLVEALHANTRYSGFNVIDRIF